jgi:hypothetical protein
MQELKISSMRAENENRHGRRRREMKISVLEKGRK